MCTRAFLPRINLISPLRAMGICVNCDAHWGRGAHGAKTKAVSHRVRPPLRRWSTMMVTWFSCFVRDRARMRVVFLVVVFFFSRRQRAAQLLCV